MQKFIGLLIGVGGLFLFVFSLTTFLLWAAGLLLVIVGALLVFRAVRAERAALDERRHAELMSAVRARGK